MKLLRYGPVGQEKPGILNQNGAIRDLSGEIDDIAGSLLSRQGLARVAALDLEALPEVSGSPRIGACVAKVGKFIGIGLNYRDHAEELGVELPAEPVIFMKTTSSICGPNDDTITPRGSTQLDWEVELGIIIGEGGVYLSEVEAEAAIAGYCTLNDVSERAFQLNGTGEWEKGKCADTFGPIGPWLVTKDEVPDPQALALWTEVNSERRQDGNTRTMAVGAVDLVSYVSRFMRLEPGDVIATGTPPGVGRGMNPPQFLKPGDKVRVSVEGLGIQHQTILPPI